VRGQSAILSSRARFTALAVLRHREFACVSLGRFFTALGWQMLGVAVSWQVYALTHDALALGLVGLCEFLPFVCLVLIGGHVADYVDRRRVLQAAYMLEALCVAALLIFTLIGGAVIWPVYIVVAVFGGTRAFWAPTMQAVVPSLVPREEFPAAVAINSMLYQSAIIGGPALGGVLFLLGAPVVYGVCFALFLLTVGLISSMQPREAAQEAAAAVDGSGHRFLEGLRFVVRQRAVLGVISLDLFAVLFGGATALLPIFAGDVLHSGPAGLGLLRTAPGAGAAIMGGLLALRPINRHGGAWMFGGVAVFGVATIIFALSTTFWLSLAALFALGAGDMLSVYIRSVLVQLNTPDAIRGRVSAVNAMFIGASNELGEFESGFTAAWFGLVPAIVAGGVVTLLVAALWAGILFPRLWRLQTFDQLKDTLANAT